MDCLLPNPVLGSYKDLNFFEDVFYIRKIFLLSQEFSCKVHGTFTMFVVTRLFVVGGAGPVGAQIRELLSFYKFNGDDIPLVMGSALAAVEGRDKEVGEDAIVELMQAVDDHIPTPVRGERRRIEERQRERAPGYADESLVKFIQTARVGQMCPAIDTSGPELLAGRIVRPQFFFGNKVLSHLRFIT